MSDIQNEIPNNDWLLTTESIYAVPYPDKEYITELFRLVTAWLHRCPVPIITDWPSECGGLRSRIGMEGNGSIQIFKPSPRIHPKTFVDSMNSWASQFFPRYVKTFTDSVPYTSEEQANLIREGTATDIALKSMKTVERKEKGVIVEVYIPNDEFHIEINGVRHKRISTIPLSRLLKLLRHTTDYDEKYDLIFKNSRRDGNDEIPNDLDIHHSGPRLESFVKANIDEIARAEPIELGNGFWKLGRYRVNFRNDESLLMSCLDMIEYQKLLKNTKEKK